MKNNFFPKIISFVLFVALLATGFHIAKHKPLWNDEVYSQIASIEQMSVLGIISAKIPRTEGNNFPLFYLLQKGICRIGQYQLPDAWKGEGSLRDPYAQVFLRIMPVVCISLSIVLIFFYFSSCYSWWSGWYGLILALSSFMIWAHWAESRPYALWVFLTTLQSLLFLSFLKNESSRKTIVRGLIFVHLLLSLTIIFGLAQIVFVSLLLWLGGERQWKKYLLLTLLPIGLSLFYYANSKANFKLFLPQNPLHLIELNVTKDQIIIFAIYFSFLVFYRILPQTLSWKRFLKPTSNPKDHQKLSFDFLSGQKEAVAYFVLTFLFFLMALGVLVFFEVNPYPPEGFVMNMRYFIYLTPCGIIAATLFASKLIEAFKGNKWMLINIIITLVGLLILRVFNNYMLIIGMF